MNLLDPFFRVPVLEATGELRWVPRVGLTMRDIRRKRNMRMVVFLLKHPEFNQKPERGAL